MELSSTNDMNETTKEKLSGNLNENNKLESIDEMIAILLQKMDENSMNEEEKKEILDKIVKL